MTQEEKKRIGKMRVAGMSYARIAETLDISVNSVKSYCRRHGLGADVILQETQFETVIVCPPPNEAAACEQCGSPVWHRPVGSVAGSVRTNADRHGGQRTEER